MKKILAVFGVWLFTIPALFSHEIPEAQAWPAARNFYLAQVPPGAMIPGAVPGMSGSYMKSDGVTPLYYIFNLHPEGWIAIAANDDVFPILAYAFEGSYDPLNEAPQFSAWMKQYEDQIRFAVREQIPPFPHARELWRMLADTGYRKDNIAFSRFLPHPSSFVPPLITTHWNQSPWYNEFCPADPSGPGGHCVAGCVPVCMAQVMYYFRWPATGTGSYTYTDPNYGVQSADFGATTYRWNEMTNAINRSNTAIAELIYHLGVSCDLQYGPGGSGMYNHKAAYSLRTYFKYSPETQYLFRDSTNLNWDSVLIAHLDRKIPMYYAGWSVPNVNGHAFVCDGYQDSCFFHFNFGWGGNSDGYFYTSDLTPGGNNFNLAQEVVINGYPDTTTYSWPVQCAGGLVLLNKVGSLEDGSGPIDPYLPTANCMWLIDPQTGSDSVTSITLEFGRFALGPSDFVTVYDGSSTTAPLLGAFSGDTLPQSITSTGNQMLITFIAGGPAPGNGFYATYSTHQPVWCTGITNIKADTAEFSDGSFRFDYYNNTLCKWKVESLSGSPLTIFFSKFDTEEEKDFLTIYDLVSGDTLAFLSGHYLPGSLPDSVTSPSGKMFILFLSNSSVTADGWEIYYPRRPNIGIPDPAVFSQVKIFPNPATSRVSLEFNAAGNSIVTVALLGLDGRPVRTQESLSRPGKNIQSLDISGIQPGIYFIRIQAQGSPVVQKLLIL